MNYIEKVFKQYPFVYCIDDDYYAFGTGVCAKLDDGSVLLQSRYERYKNALSKEISREEAWDIFRKLVSEATWKKDNLGYQGNDLNNFMKLNFNEEEIKELERQVKSYIDYFQKYNLKDFY